MFMPFHRQHNCPIILFPRQTTRTCPRTHSVTPCQQVDTTSAEDDYAKVLGYSYLFYEAQQSGVLPGWNRLLYGTSGPYGTGYKKNAHVDDGSVIGKDLSGGWYDAGGGCPT
eukprot:GHUV01036208.1.p2 GENE.GHUV01036208.1~~GHUV01036208.1.p2  ORF type:complete len:112 (+),score=19.33 GHUV01036208.1:663-998(+)